MNSLDKMEDYDRLAAALVKEKVKSEELRREVVMLRDAIKPWTKYGNVGTRDIEVAKAISAFDNTQATAEAYEREVAAKALDNAADEQMIYADTSSGVVYRLRLMASKIRAANKGKEIV